MKKWVSIICVILSISIPLTVIAAPAENGSYYAAGWARKQVENFMQPIVVLVDQDMSLTSWRTPVCITDFDMRGSTVFFAIMIDLAQITTNPDNVYVYNHDNSNNRLAATMIDQYSFFWAYDEYVQLKFAFYRVDIPTTWDPCYNLNFTQFFSNRLPTSRQAVQGTVPYNYINSYDLGMLAIDRTSTAYDDQILTYLQSIDSDTNQIVANTYHTYLQSVQINTNLSAALDLLDTIDANTAQISTTTRSILTALNLILNQSGQDQEAVEDAEFKVDALSDDTNNMITSFNSVDKPDISGQNLDADSYIDNSALNAAINLFGSIFNNNFVITLMLISATMAVASFAIFGKKL